MTMVVGFAPDGRGRAVLHLAAMLARSGSEDLVVCAVVPSPWPPSPAKVDAEYQAYLEGAAENALGHGCPPTYTPPTRWCTPAPGRPASSMWPSASTRA
jgi:hypothetical protein